MSSQIAGLSDLGVSEEKMFQYMESLRTGIGDPSRHVCICGHLIKRHSSTSVNPYCSFGKSFCMCAEPLPALEVEDLRYFGFTTTGCGVRHALSKGLFAHNQKGNNANWLITRNCFRCKSDGIPVQITPLNRAKRVVNSSGYFNALLCSSCLFECGGSWSHS